MSTAAKTIVGILVICLAIFGSIALHNNSANGFLIRAIFQIEQFVNGIIENNAPIQIIEEKPEKIYTDAWVKSDGLNFRPSPSVNSTPIRQLRRGDIVRVFEVRSDGWARVGNSFNEEGFVDNDFLQY